MNDPSAGFIVFRFMECFIKSASLPTDWAPGDVVWNVCIKLLNTIVAVPFTPGVELTKTISLLTSSNGEASKIDCLVAFTDKLSFSNTNNDPPSSSTLYWLTLPPAPPSKL